MKTVQQLIDELSDYPPTAMVVQSSDGEGNKISPTADVSHAAYFAENTWSGSITEMDDLIDLGPGDPQDYEMVVVLWPTN